MNFHEKLRQGEVLVPTVERVVASDSHREILGLTNSLREIPRLKDCYTPNTKDTLIVPILSYYESIAAFSLAPEENKKEAPINGNWHKAVFDIMLESDSFRDPLEVDTASIKLLGSGPAKRLALILFSEIGNNERQIAEKSFLKLSPEYQPRKHRFQISLGTVTGKPVAALEAARSLLDIEKVNLVRGRINKNMPMKVLDPNVVKAYFRS